MTPIPRELEEQGLLVTAVRNVPNDIGQEMTEGAGQCFTLRKLQSATTALMIPIYRLRVAANDSTAQTMLSRASPLIAQHNLNAARRSDVLAGKF